MTRFRARGSGVCALLTALSIIYLSGGGLAQERRLTIGTIYDPDNRISFGGRTPSGVAWLSDNVYLERQPGSGDLLAVDVSTGRTERWLVRADLERALAAVPGIGGGAARDVARNARFVWNLSLIHI